MHHCARDTIMRTTLDLPENLLREAMECTHTGPQTAVIIKALEVLIRKSKISDIKEYKGKIDLKLDMDVIRDRH